MGFDIFLSTLSDDDLFDRAIAERAFGSLIAYRDEDTWGLQSPMGELYSGYVFIKSGEKISGFAVDRPAFVPEFWSAMFEVLEQTRTILAWPGSGSHPCCCVANREFAPDVPADLTEELNGLVIVSSGAEIVAAINLT